VLGHGEKKEKKKRKKLGWVWNIKGKGIFHFMNLGI
jgi:hypothetical protein